MRDAPTGGDTISRNAMLAFAAQMSTAAFTAGLTIFLTRQLGPAGFGLFSLALSVTALVLRPAGAGTSQAVGRFIAERHGDLRAIGAIIGMALRFRIQTATAVGVVLFALAEPIAVLYGEPDLTGPLRGMALAFISTSLFEFFRTIFVSLRLASRTFTSIVSESAMETLATVTFVLLGGGATGATLGRAAGYAFGALIAMLLLGRVLGRSPLRPSGRSPVPRREFFGYAGAMLVVSTGTSVFQRLGILMLGAFMTASAVGVYSAALSLIALFGYPALAIAQGVGPRQARHATQPARTAALDRALRYVIMFHAAIVAFVLVWSTAVVELLLGSEFSESADVLRALTPLILMNGVGLLLFSSLGYAGEGRRRIPIVAATVLVAAVLYVVLIPPMGVVGAAIATDVAYLVNVGGHLWLAHRFLDLPLGSVAGAFLRSLIATGVTVGLLALVGGTDPSLLELIVGLLVGPAAFLGVLVTTGGLTRKEIRTLVRLPAEAFRRGR